MALRLRIAVALAALTLTPAARAFTQRGGPFPWGGTVLGNPLGTPPGHEAVTGFGWARAQGMDPDSPEVQRVVDVYTSSQPNSLAPRSAVYGVRWVDLMGYAIVLSTGMRGCFDYVAQSNHDIQYDHALRSDFDDGEEGRRRTMVATIARIRRAWLAALRARPGATLTVRDGGATATTETVDEAHFLLGVALHPLQDAYSPEHARRVGRDMDLRALGDRARNDRVVWVDATGYGCTEGIWQHNHTVPAMGSGSGDLIWRDHDPDDRYALGRTRYLLPYAEPAVAATEALFRAYDEARRMSGDEAARAAVLDRELVRRYLLVALDPWWASPLGPGDNDPGACSSSQRQTASSLRASMECGREQCLTAIERANGGLTITDLRAPVNYRPMSGSPSMCIDPSGMYSH